jgi:translation elongation factor EF-Tu-like GTPase
MPAFSFTDVVDSNSAEPIRVLARISVVRTEDGGKSVPFTSKYRPNHNFGTPDERLFYIGQVEVPEGTWVHPGDTRDLVVTFIDGKGLKDFLKAGRVWRIQEGPKLVATAQVLSILSAA